VTSHTAIIARELGIPCLVGTRIATDVFRDGEMVELDTDRATVKKTSAAREK
jgi:pyruvate,water dikinase